MQVKNLIYILSEMFNKIKSFDKKVEQIKNFYSTFILFLKSISKFTSNGNVNKFLYEWLCLSPDYTRVTCAAIPFIIDGTTSGQPYDFSGVVSVIPSENLAEVRAYLTELLKEKFLHKSRSVSAIQFKKVLQAMIAAVANQSGEHLTAEEQKILLELDEDPSSSIVDNILPFLTMLVIVSLLSALAATAAILLGGSVAVVMIISLSIIVFFMFQ